MRGAGVVVRHVEQRVDRVADLGGESHEAARR
jgi:hypothetical protein